jgi:hypothetical protein
MTFWKVRVFEVREVLRLFIRGESCVGSGGSPSAIRSTEWSIHHARLRCQYQVTTREITTCGDERRDLQLNTGGLDLSRFQCGLGRGLAPLGARPCDAGAVAEVAEG